MATYTLPRAFVWRRVHSLMGLWLALFLTEHLLTNSQAALLLGDNGGGFVRMVNLIHDLPYLPAIELFLIGTPILIHAVWGIKYLFTSKSNAKGSDGSKPALKEYKRNKYLDVSRDSPLLSQVSNCLPPTFSLIILGRVSKRKMVF